MYQCPRAADILLENSQTQVFTPHLTSPERATDIYTIRILLVLQSQTGLQMWQSCISPTLLHCLL